MPRILVSERWVLERYYHSPYGEVEVVAETYFGDYDGDGDVDADDADERDPAGIPRFRLWRTGHAWWPRFADFAAEPGVEFEHGWVLSVFSVFSSRVDRENNASCFRWLK